MLGKLEATGECVDLMESRTPSFTSPIRVAVVCDFLEEYWLSMDLVGDMLCQHLAANCSNEVAVTQARPPLRRRITRIPLVPSKLSWNADRLINRFFDYPSLLRDNRADYDVFHLVDHSYAQLLHGLPSGRTVITCHDLDTFRCVIEPDREHRPRWFRAMSRRILEGFSKAAHVIAVSSVTREELLRHRLFSPERISVVPNGVHPAYTPAPCPAAEAAAARLLPGDNGAVWLLNVGSTLQRKRLDVLLRVFAAIRHEFPEVRLVRAGGGLTPAQLQLSKELKVDDAIVVLPFLERETLAAVYRRSGLLIHTAEAEGFGLPLIEAMACGCPVVASDVPVLREVGACAAVYCRVADVNHWKERLVGLLREKLQQPNVWEFRRQAGITHAAQFSWAENARQTAHIYRKVLGQ